MRRIALEACISMAAAAHGAEPWREASSEHFVIYAQQREDRLRAYAEQLERFDAALRHLYPAAGSDQRPHQRLTIYALHDGAAVRRVMGAGSGNVEGVYRPSAAGSLALTSFDAGGGDQGLTARILLQHEYAHHFMFNRFAAAYPRWFVEGFAEFVSTARPEKDGGLGVGIPAQHRAFDLWAGNPLPIAKLVGDDFRLDEPAAMSSLYGYGWLLTHYLFFEPSRAGQLPRYLARINAGVAPLKAAKEAFGDLNKLQTNLALYRGQSRMSYIGLSPKETEAGPVTLRTVTPAENAIMPIRIQSKYGVDRKEALKLVGPARAAAAPYPNDVAAQCMLAEAEDDAGNPDASAAAADRALATDPKAYCALLYRGRIENERALARSAPADDPQWTAARGWFAKANRADVENPMPMFLYYLTYLNAKARPSTNAVTALLGAAARAPQDTELRTAATIQLLRESRDEEARIMLGPVANAAHGGADADWLRSVYARIGSEPPTTLADALAGGPPKKVEAAAK